MLAFAYSLIGLQHHILLEKALPFEVKGTLLQEKVRRSLEKEMAVSSLHGIPHLVKRSSPKYHCNSSSTSDADATLNWLQTHKHWCDVICHGCMCQAKDKQTLHFIKLQTLPGVWVGTAPRTAV